MFLIFLLWACFAVVFILCKEVACCAPVTFGVGVRMVLAGTMLSAWSLLRQATPPFRHWPWSLFLKIATFHIFLAFNLEFWAAQTLDPVKISLLYCLTPVITAVLCYFLRNERLGVWQTISIGLAVASALALNLIGRTWAELLSFGGAELVVIGAIASASYAWLDIDYLQKQGWSIILINGVAMLLGGIASLLMHTMQYSFAVPAIMNWPQFLMLIGVVILLSDIIGYNLYGYLLRFYSLTFLALSGFLCPVFTAGFVWAYCGCVPSLEQVIAYLIILLAIVIFTLGKLPAKEGER